MNQKNTSSALESLLGWQYKALLRNRCWKTVLAVTCCPGPQARSSYFSFWVCAHDFPRGPYSLETNSGGTMHLLHFGLPLLLLSPLPNPYHVSWINGDWALTGVVAVLSLGEHGDTAFVSLRWVIRPRDHWKQELGRHGHLINGPTLHFVQSLTQLGSQKGVATKVSE